MKNLTLIILMSFTTLSWSQAKMHCESKIKCALYRDGEFVKEARCFRITPKGDIRAKVQSTVKADLHISASGDPDIQYNVTANGSEKDLFGKSINREWFYNIIQLEEYNNHQYRLKAGIVMHEAKQPIQGNEIDHLNLDSYGADRFPEFIADKGTSLNKTFNIMVPLNRTYNYDLKSTAKNLLKAAAIMPAITFNAIKSQMVTGEIQCGNAKDAPLDRGEVLYAKSMTISCNPIN